MSTTPDLFCTHTLNDGRREVVHVALIRVEHRFMFTCNCNKWLLCFFTYNGFKKNKMYICLVLHKLQSIFAFGYSLYGFTFKIH